MAGEIQIEDKLKNIALGEKVYLNGADHLLSIPRGGGQGLSVRILP